MSRPDFTSVTELGGTLVAAEQVERVARRYHWAAEYCAAKDVLEAACGSGLGLGHLGSVARSVTAGDISEALLESAHHHYRGRVRLAQLDAQRMPFRDDSFDVVILFEALYYIPDVTRFFRECRRVLRPGGALLISTANKDLFDFNPSPFSQRYLGAVELSTELANEGFAVSCFGDTPVTTVGPRQRALRPIKAMAARFGLIPGSMRAKQLLKRLVFGRLVPMPSEITAATAPRAQPARLDPSVPDRVHKVIFTHAVLTG